MELCLKLNYCSAGKVEENRCHDYCICKGDSLLHLRALCNPQPPHCLLSLEAPNVTSITPVPFVHFILAGVNKGSEMGRDLGDAEHHVEFSERILAWVAQTRHGGHLVQQQCLKQVLY